MENNKMKCAQCGLTIVYDRRQRLACPKCGMHQRPPRVRREQTPKLQRRYAWILLAAIGMALFVSGGLPMGFFL